MFRPRKRFTSSITRLDRTALTKASRSKGFRGETSTRHLVLNAYSLNFTLELKDEKATFKFNFHFDIEDLIAFKGKIHETPILVLKQEALKLLSEVYGLKSGGRYR